MSTCTVENTWLVGSFGFVGIGTVEQVETLVGIADRNLCGMGIGLV